MWCDASFVSFNPPVCVLCAARSLPPSRAVDVAAEEKRQHGWRWRSETREPTELWKFEPFYWIGWIWQFNGINYRKPQTTPSSLSDSGLESAWNALLPVRIVFSACLQCFQIHLLTFIICQLHGENQEAQVRFGALPVELLIPGLLLQPAGPASPANPLSHAVYVQRFTVCFLSDCRT